MENLFGGWQISTCDLQRNRKVTVGRRDQNVGHDEHHRTAARATELATDIRTYLLEVLSMTRHILCGFQAAHGHRGQGCLPQ